MKKLALIIMSLFMLTACQKSIEERAEEEARAYTEKYCPTPVYNNTRTDSLIFTRADRTFIYYCSLTGALDSLEIINQFRSDLHDGLLKSIRESTQLKLYKDAGFNFRYIIRSEKSPETVLFESTFKPEEYN